MIYIFKLLSRFIAKPVENITGPTKKRRKLQQSFKNYVWQFQTTTEKIFMLPIYAYILYLFSLKPVETKDLLNVNFDDKGEPNIQELDCFLEKCYTDVKNHLSICLKNNAYPDILCLVPENYIGLNI